MNLSKPQLPFDYAALEPHISAQTVETHFAKHHLGYFDKLETGMKQFAGTADTVEQLLTAANGRLVDMAAQVWNHSFYWSSISPQSTELSDELAKRLTENFGGVNVFRREFAQAALEEFGSGWAWLVLNRSNQLQITSTTDAVNPLSLGVQPLLVLDVWEHAYYLDYKNERGSYVQVYLDHLINWTFLQQNLEEAEGKPISK